MLPILPKRKFPFLQVELIVLSVTLFVFAIHALRIYSSNVINDDAFIFYRYAENWARGFGFVWNVGEPPVDGFTSFTYVLLLGVAACVGIAPVVAGQCIGLVSAIGVLFVVQKMAHDLFSDLSPLYRVLPALFLAITPNFVLWSRYGMETTLFMLVLIVAMWAHFTEVGSKKILSSVLFAVATMTRPDALLFWLVAQIQVVVSHVINGLTTSRRPRALWLEIACAIKKIVPALAVFYGMIAAYLAWHFWYFGSLLPNTFYAKSGGGVEAVKGGIKYLLLLLREPIAGVLWLMPFGVIIGRSNAPIQRTLRVYSLMVSVGYLSYVVWIGGDHFPHFRFYLYFLPLLVVVTTGILAQASRGLSVQFSLKHEWLIALVLIAPLAYAVSFPSFQEAISHRGRLIRPVRLIDEYDGSNEAQHQRELIGYYFKRISRPGESLAVVSAGAIPYFSGLTTIDMLGLNDRYLAHQPVDLDFVRSNPRGWFPGHMKGDGYYVLGRKPTYIVIAPILSDSPNHIPEWYTIHYRPTMQIWQSEYFHRCYDMVSVALEGKYFTYHRLKPECTNSR